MTVTRYLLRIRMLDALGDQRPRAWGGRPTNEEYNKDERFRLQVTGPCHTVFGAACWVCGRTKKDLLGVNDHLSCAHILYPSQPFEEIIDTDLTRSDVVLLCWFHHQEFDRLTDALPCATMDDLRFRSIAMLERMRIGWQTGEEAPDED